MFKIKFAVIGIIIFLGTLTYPCNAQNQENYFVGKWYSIDNYNLTEGDFIWEFTETKWIWDNAAGGIIPRNYRVLGNNLVIEKLEWLGTPGYTLSFEILDQNTFILHPTASDYPTIDNVQIWKRLLDNNNTLSGWVPIMLIMSSFKK